jgi:hypothetical protein
LLDQVWTPVLVSHEFKRPVAIKHARQRKRVMSNPPISLAENPEISLAENTETDSPKGNTPRPRRRLKDTQRDKQDGLDVLIQKTKAISIVPEPLQV